MRSSTAINKGAMSEAQLKKLQKDCSKMEDELNVYRNTVNLVEASAGIIDHLKQSSEPLSMGTKNGNGTVEENPWAGGGADGGCTIS